MEDGIMFHTVQSLVTVIRKVPYKTSRQIHNISRDLKELVGKPIWGSRENGQTHKFMEKLEKLDRWVDPISPVFVLYSPLSRGRICSDDLKTFYSHNLQICTSALG